MSFARNDPSIDDTAIMSFDLEKREERFDLEFFMKSTDVGLYNIAKKIFSSACQQPRDLVEFRKVNKTFQDFITGEEDKFRKGDSIC